MIPQELVDEDEEVDGIHSRRKRSFQHQELENVTVDCWWGGVGRGGIGCLRDPGFHKESSSLHQGGPPSSITFSFR